MPKYPYEPTAEEIEQVDPDDGPWEVEIYHRLFHYVPNLDDDGEPLGFAYARNGDVITITQHDDLVRGLKHGAFVNPATSYDEVRGEGPGDFAARSDLVEFVKEHKVDDVVARAGSDPDMAQLLMDAENEAKPSRDGEARKGVISGLQAVIDEYLDPNTPAGAGEGDLTLDDHARAVATGTEPEHTEPENEDGASEEDHSEEE